MWDTQSDKEVERNFLGGSVSEATEERNGEGEVREESREVSIELVASLSSGPSTAVVERMSQLCRQ